MTKQALSARLALTGLVALTGVMTTTGCARPGEMFYTPAYSADERGRAIARNWDNEGKMMQDDIDNALLLRPQSRLTPWNLR
jgi:hypothetical protein